MSRHGEEGFVQAERRAQQLELLGHLPALAVELNEDLDLAGQHVRLDRLVQEIDGPGLVAPEQAGQVVGRSRQKKMGM